MDASMDGKADGGMDDEMDVLVDDEDDGWMNGGVTMTVDSDRQWACSLSLLFLSQKSCAWSSMVARMLLIIAVSAADVAAIAFFWEQA